MNILRFKRPTGLIFIIFCFVLLTAITSLQANSHHNGGNQYSWPDSLTIQTFTGIVIVDSTFFHPSYFIDSNGDGTAEYQLMFGPWWYTPDNGAEWPRQDESVTIVGAISSMKTNQGFEQVIVFEINGLKWRESIAVGGHGWNMDRFWEKNGDTLTVTGKVFEDTTYFYPIFFLDIDADSLPDYGLNFGPPWFQPANGSVRPEHGEIVTIFGRVHSGMLGFQMLMVSQINGEEWQPLDAPASWAGSWMLRNHSDSTFVFCANDSSNWLGFAPGHMGSGMGGMGGMRWPDSTFMQFWEIYPDSLPGGHMSENFMGFYANILDPAGNSMMGGSMWGGNNWGGHHGWMNFEKNHQLHFQYREEDLHSYGFNENTVELHYWDPSQDSWKKANNAVVNTSENTVSLTSNEIYTYYTLRAVKTTTGVKTASRTVPAVKLYSNYPNPFNPETSISFEMITGGQVRLDIYNIAGQHLLTLLNEVRDAGSHLIKWNGRDFKGKQMPSGIYLLKIQANEQSAIQRMTLLK